MNKTKSAEAIGLRLVDDHVNRVQNYMVAVLANLAQRTANHDRSKFTEKEIALVLGKADLDKHEYMSDEERAALDNIKTAVQHHYAKNSHHPEHYHDGIDGMSLLDILEMACDWKAASESSKNGSYLNSIKQNTARFGLSIQMQYILMNTGRELGWID